MRFFSFSYLLANPGLVHEFQCINVEDFPGASGPQGETEPNPYFFQVAIAITNPSEHILDPP